MEPRTLGRAGILVTPIGYGAVKIGRNEGVKYPHRFDLPDPREAAHLLNGILDLGIAYIDTAPAYGLSEQRIGEAIGHRGDAFVVSTKVGETFAEGRSRFDFSAHAVRHSVDRSRELLRRDVLDLVYVHSDGRDVHVQERTDAVATLCDLRDSGAVGALGFSGKTAEGFRAALAWADAIMIEYSPVRPELAGVMDEASAAGVGVVVKKGLASGHTAAEQAIRFVLEHPAVSSLLIGGLSLEHMRLNTEVARTF